MSKNLNDNLGQHLLVGLSGSKLTELDKRMLGELKPLGILLFKRNFLANKPYDIWLKELETLLKDVREYTERSELIISLDHEGGALQNAPSPITDFGKPINYAPFASEVANAMAVELSSLGVNLSWAPLADIASNPNSPIIGKLGRAFSSDTDEVSEISVNFARALMQNGVAACAKHFPGHGHAFSDSHLELPVLDLTIEQIRERELKPFKALIKAGVPFVMTAHIMFPKVDPLFPATLSKKILNEILRKELEFKGVVVADNIEMDAVDKMFNDEDAVASSFNASADLFIVSRHENSEKNERPFAFAKLLKRAVESGKINEETLRASQTRIATVMRDSIKQHKVSRLALDVFEKHQELLKKIND